VRVPSSSPVATTFPLHIYHTTTTLSREALRPWNLNVNYLPPPLILSSPPSSPKNVKKQSAKYRIMDDHSGPKRTSSQPPPPPPTVVQHRPDIIADVSSPTTEAPPAMLNLDDNYSSSDEAYIEPAGSITPDHSAKWHKKTLKKPIQNFTDLPELPTFDPLQPIIHPHKAWNRLPISFSELDAITPIQCSNSFLPTPLWTACSLHHFLCPAADSWAREGAAEFLAASYCSGALSLAGNSNSYGSYWSSS